MNRLNNKRISALLAGVLALIIATMDAQAKQAQTKFLITPKGSSTVTVPPNGTAPITYTVTNKLPTQVSLVMSHLQGVTQVTSGVGNLCQNPMVLNPGGSCALLLSVDGSQFPLGQTTTIANSPKLCIATSQLSCSQPNLADWLKVNIVTSGVTLVYTTQPSTPQNINGGTGTTLVYKIQNTSGIPAQYAPVVTTDINMTASVSSDTCGGSIAPMQTCEIDVAVSAQSVVSPITGNVNFSVKYGVSLPLTSLLVATPVVFNITPSVAALSFVAPNPIAPNLAPGQTGAPLVFTLSNATSSPVPFTATVTASNYDSSIVSNACGGSVPANGTCTVSVTLTANSGIVVSTTVIQSLNIAYGSLQNLVAPLSYTVTVTASSDLTFSQLPTPSSVSLSVNTQSDTPNVTSTISNSGSTSRSFQAVATPSTSAFDTILLSNSCGGVISANGSCDIYLNVVTNNTTTSGITHNLSVYYGPNLSYRIQAQPTFEVIVKNANPLALTFTQVSAPNSQIIGGTAQRLPYTITNASASSIQLNKITLDEAQGNTGASTTTLTYTGGSGTACNNGSGFVPLDPHQTCYVFVNISAPTGTSTAGLVNQYLNVTSTTPTITQILSYSVLTSPLSFVAEPLAQDMGVGQTQTLVYGIHNSNPNDAVAFQTPNAYGPFPNQTPSGANLFNVNFSNSCNGLVPPNGNCSVSAVITANSIGSVSNFALVISNGTGTLLTSTFPVAFNITTQTVPSRTLTFTNNCPISTWIGLNGGASNNVTSTNAPPNPHIAGGSSSTCNSNADCPNGTTCVTTNIQTQTKLCFWNNGTPVGGFALASGASATVALPEYDQVTANDKNTVWSGNVSARTGCSTNGLCQTADCSGASTTVTQGVNEPDSTQGCFPGTGSAPPNTLAEFTLSRMSQDFYDVSIINGANIPISMRPTTLDSYQTTQHGYNGYICGEPGKTTATTYGPGKANWDFTAPNSSAIPSAQYVNVLFGSGSTGCLNCVSPHVCGLTFNPTTNSFESYCGTFLGYWTGDQICGTNNGSGASPGFNCGGNAGVSGFPSATISDLYKCDMGIPSCYNNPQNLSCCGCANWNDVTSVGALVPGSPLVTACPNPGTQAWNTYLQVASGSGTDSTNNIAWLKAAVPSAYTYPYDDPSSTFTCPDCAGGPGQAVGSSQCTIPAAEFNTSNYTITFCPAGTLIPPP